MKLYWIIGLLTLSSSHAADEGILAGKYACTYKEDWTFPKDFYADFKEEFQKFIRKGRSPVSGFVSAAALRREATSESELVFSEYWISRALYEAGLPHVAYKGFVSVLGHEPNPDILGPQLAASECLRELKEKHPFKGFPDNTVNVLKKGQDWLTKNAKPHWTAAITEDTWKTAIVVLQNQFSEKKSKTDLQATVQLLKGAGAYEQYGRGLYESSQNSYSQAIAQLEPLLKTGLPAHFKVKTEQFHLTLARAYYTVGRYGDAAVTFKRVSKSSNELAQSISELAWAYLLKENHPGALGAAFSLQRGGMRKTFAPEGPMVMAMAFNELCQYPFSLSSMDLLRKNYKTSHEWLTAWDSKKDKNSYPFYEKTIEQLKHKTDVPDRIANEWMRSPTFIALQTELNALIDEKVATGKLGKSGADEQRRLAFQIVELARETRDHIRKEKLQMEAGEKYSGQVLNRLSELRKLVTHYQDFRLGAPIWKVILDNFKTESPQMKSQILATINNDMRRKTQFMKTQLDEVTENLQLIEVEIYNGASQDLVWQNAHPDYKDVAKRMNDDAQKEAAQKTWNWGRAPSGLDEEDGEVWEDELGAFEAKLFDNCNSKEKFLALKRKMGK